MDTMILLFFGLLLGYIGVAIWVGLGVGGWLTRNARRPVRVLVQALCVAVLLYLPIWDYIPGKILFDRHCSTSGGLQIFNGSSFETVYFEGEHEGYCGDCFTALGTELVRYAEGNLEEPNDPEQSLLRRSGFVRFSLAPDSDPRCAPFRDYLERVNAWRGQSTPEKFKAFWLGVLPPDLAPRVFNRCVTWQYVEKASTHTALERRSTTRRQFWWTYLYESRVELRRRDQGSLAASYSAYQYHPWFNTNVIEGPRLFIFRCPAPDEQGLWTISFRPSKLFIEMSRKREEEP